MELPVEFFEEEPTSGLSRRKRYQTLRLVGEAALAQSTAFEHRLRRYAASVVTNSLRQATSVVFPDVAEACVATTAPPSHSQQDSAWKEATLDNGLSIHVPLFIASGEIVRVNVKTGRYVERARAERKRSA
jgi:hypothetical protein